MTEWILSSSILIVMFLALRRLLMGRISLRMQYALWAVVVVRLLVPWNLAESVISVQNFLPAPEIVENQVQAGTQTPHQSDKTGPETDNPAIQDAPQTGEVSGDTAQQNPGTKDSQNQPPEQAGDAPVSQGQAPVQTPATQIPAVTPAVDLGKVLYTVWLLGVAVMGAFVLGSNVIYVKKLRRNRRELVIPGCPVAVYGAPGVETPCLVGIARPEIYVTEEVAGDEAALNHVVAHEITHLKHMDHVTGLLRSACLVLHWYNPLVWLAVKLMRSDCELACDEGTVARLGEQERIAYGQTLIRLTCKPAHPGELLLSATTMTGGNSIKDRIRNLAQRPRTVLAAAVAGMAVICILVGCTFTGAVESTEPTEPPETTATTEPVETTKSIKYEDIVLSDNVTINGDPAKVDCPPELYEHFLPFAQERMKDYECDSARINIVTPLENGEKLAVYGLYLYDTHYSLRSETQIHDRGEVLIFHRQADGTWEYVKYLHDAEMDWLFTNEEVDSKDVEQWGGSHQAAAAYYWQRISTDIPYVDRDLQTVMDAIVTNTGLTVSCGDITYDYHMDSWEDRQWRGISNNADDWERLDPSLVSQYIQGDAVTVADQAGNYLRVYDSEYLILELCLAGEAPLFWRGEYRSYFITEDRFSMYRNLFYRESMDLYWITVEAGDAMEALNIFAKDIIPGRHLKVHQDNPYYALEARLVSEELYDVKVSEDGLSATGWITYAIRQPELNFMPYGNVDEGTGEWEGWLIFHSYVSVVSSGDGIWRESQD